MLIKRQGCHWAGHQGRGVQMPEMGDFENAIDELI